MGDRVGASVLGSARSLVGWRAGAPSRALTAVRGLPAKATWTQKQPRTPWSRVGGRLSVTRHRGPAASPLPCPQADPWGSLGILVWGGGVSGTRVQRKLLGGLWGAT